MMNLQEEETGIIRGNESSMIAKIGIYAGQVLMCLEAPQGQMSMNALFGDRCSLKIVVNGIGVTCARKTYTHSRFGFFEQCHFS
ncbi:MAG: hypothetical protein WC530_05570 [Candidatus Omnitrophota bacterium]